MYPRILFWLNYRRNHVGEGTLAVPSPFDGDPTVPYWYDKIASMALQLAHVGCTDVLFPNPVTGSGGQADNQDGYGPYDDYDIGSKNVSRFGSAEKFRRAVALFHANGIDVHLDVINHQRSGGPNGTYVYNSVGGKGLGRFPKYPSYFRGAPPRVPEDPVPSPSDDFAFGDEFCPVNATPKGADGKSLVWDGLIAAGDWLFRTSGADGARLDDMKGLNIGFMNAWMNSGAMKGKFFFGEYASGNSNDTNWWCGQVDERASVIDFDFHYNMAQEACMNQDFYMGSLAGRGMISSNPMHAVPFVESMDSDTNGFATIVFNKILGYALLLGGEGLPIIYIRDYLSDPDCYGLHPGIDNLCWVHQMLASGYTIPRYQSQHIYVFERTADLGLLVSLNNDVWNPNWYSVTVQTNWNPGTIIHDYTGHNTQDCEVDEKAQATFGIPPGANGTGYGCWAPWGNYKTITLQPGRYTTQEFFGADDLDIAPLTNTKFTVGRIWCASNSSITFTLTDADGNVPDFECETTITSPDGTPLLNVLTDHFKIKATQDGWHTLALAGLNLPTTARVPFILSVTYLGTEHLTAAEF